MALYGICENKRLKAYGYNKGRNAKGLWQYFLWTEKERDATGTLIPKFKYQIWIANEDELNLEDGQDVIITRIISSINKDAYLKVDGKSRKITICHQTCFVEKYVSKKKKQNMEIEDNFGISDEDDEYDFL